MLVTVFAHALVFWVPLQDTALTSLKVSAQLCGELLAECQSAPPEALLTAAMQLHDHALLVRICIGRMLQHVAGTASVVVSSGPEQRTAVNSTGA